MKKILLILLCLPIIGFGQEWSQTFGDEDSELGYSVQQTTDGGYIIVGSTSSFGNGQTDVYLIKTDENGNEQWSQTFGGEDSDAGYSVQQTSDGGYIIAGDIGSFGNGFSDVYLIKTDDSGNEQWSQTIGGTNRNDRGTCVLQTTDGGYIITGVKNYVEWEWGEFSDDWLIKTDGNGNQQWNQSFGGYQMNDIHQTNDGGYIILNTNLYSKPSEFSGTFYSNLIKTDINGNEQWSQPYLDSVFSGKSFQQTSDGGYIIVGSMNFENVSNDVYLMKTDGNGNEQWRQNFGGTENDYGKSVQQTTDGGYIIVGSTSSFGNGQTDVYLFKTDGNGNVTSTFEIPLPNPNRKLEKTVNLKGQEVKPLTNQPIIEIYDDGTVEKKVIIE